MKTGTTSGPASQDDVELRAKFLGVVARSLDRNPKDVKMSSRIFGGLGAESLDLLDLTFSLEMEFRVRMPRTDLLLRSAEYLGYENVMKEGVITDLGLEIIRRSMPEVDPRELRPGLTVTGFRDLIRVDSIYRLLCRLIDLKRQTVCPSCSGGMQDAPDAPELVCPSCGRTLPLPSGEDLLVADLEILSKELNVSPR
jgi:acyl carrier protein